MAFSNGDRVVLIQSNHVGQAGVVTAIDGSLPGHAVLDVQLDIGTSVELCDTAMRLETASDIAMVELCGEDTVDYVPASKALSPNEWNDK